MTSDVSSQNIIGEGSTNSIQFQWFIIVVPSKDLLSRSKKTFSSMCCFFIWDLRCCLHIYIYIYMFFLIYLYIFIFIYIYIFIYLFIYIFIYLFIYLFFHLFAYMNMFIYWFVFYSTYYAYTSLLSDHPRMWPWRVWSWMAACEYPQTGSFQTKWSGVKRVVGVVLLIHRGVWVSENGGHTQRKWPFDREHDDMPLDFGVLCLQTRPHWYCSIMLIKSRIPLKTMLRR